jgi:hypothetical protein
VYVVCVQLVDHWLSASEVAVVNGATFGDGRLVAACALLHEMLIHRNSGRSRARKRSHSIDCVSHEQIHSSMMHGIKWSSLAGFELHDIRC